MRFVGFYPKCRGKKYKKISKILPKTKNRGEIRGFFTKNRVILKGSEPHLRRSRV